METQLSTTFSLLLSLLFITLHHSAAHSVSATATSPALASAPGFDFIRSCCNATLYPHVCITTLSGYVDAIQHDPAQLALVAIRVSLSQAYHAAAHFSNMTTLAHRTNCESDPRAISALHDCASTFNDAVNQMRGSLKEMGQLGGAKSEGGSHGILLELGNVQTWMSAALTNEDTCSDGFENVADGPIKAQVCGRVAAVKELTSNALALVNSFAASVGRS